MSANSVTGVSGVGSAEAASRGPGNNRGRLVGPRIVASGFVQTGSESSEKYTVMLPKSLRLGIDSYVVLIMAENPLPIDGETEYLGDSSNCKVTKLDDRWSLSEGNWRYDADVAPGGMKGFVIHTGNSNTGGGEGSRDTQLMWAIMTTGFDTTEFAV